MKRNSGPDLLKAVLYWRGGGMDLPLGVETLFFMIYITYILRNKIVIILALNKIINENDC